MGEHLIENCGGVLSDDDTGVIGVGEIGAETDGAGAGENGATQSVGDGSCRVRESEATHETTGLIITEHTSASYTGSVSSFECRVLLSPVAFC